MSLAPARLLVLALLAGWSAGRLTSENGVQSLCSSRCITIPTAVCMRNLNLKIRTCWKKKKKKKLLHLLKIKSSRFGDLVVCRWGKLQAHDDFFCFLFSRVKKKKNPLKYPHYFFFFLKKELMYKNVSVYTRKPSFFVAFLFSFGKWILWKINTFLLKIFSYNSFNIKTMGYLCFLNYVIVCYTSLSVKLSSVLLGCIADINRRCWNLKAELKTNE